MTEFIGFLFINNNNSYSTKKKHNAVKITLINLNLFTK